MLNLLEKALIKHLLYHYFYNTRFCPTFSKKFYVVVLRAGPGNTLPVNPVVGIVFVL